MFFHTKSVQLKGIGPEILVGLGLACNGAWVNMAFKSLTLYGNSSNAVSHEPVLDAIYLISIVSVCVTLSIASLMERRTWSVLAHFPTFIALAVGTAATTLFMPLGDLGGTHLQQIILVLAGVLSGFFSGLFLLYFGMALAQLTLRGRVVAAATSTIFASISFVLFNMLHPDLAIPVAVGAPLLSAFFLLFGMRYAEQDNSSPADPDSTSELGTGQEGAFSRPFFKALLRCKPSPIADPVERANWRGLVWRIAIASLLVGFASESVRTIYIQMDLVSAGQYAYAGVQAVDSLIATVCVVILALLLLLRRTERVTKDCYFAICLLLTLGIMLLPAPFLFEGMGSFVPLALSTSAYSAFGMFVWILSACICASYPHATLSGFAAIRASWALGPIFGIILGRTVLSQLGLAPQSTYIVMLISMIALIIVATFVFSEEDLGKIMAIVPTRTQQRFRYKCELVAKSFGLTERESEIMMMLAKGRNLPFIQDQLFLSKSTVSTHRQHIYQKTGVHSQQELINLVQEAE